MDVKTLRGRLGKATVVGAVVAGTLGLASGPAMASSFNTGGSTSSINTFKTGSSLYNQQHAGDDMAFYNNSGISVDMQWVNCAGTQSGSIPYDIAAGSAYRVLGTNFNAGACLHINFRGFTQTGSFSGTTYWNYNFA